MKKRFSHLSYTGFTLLKYDSIRIQVLLHHWDPTHSSLHRTYSDNQEYQTEKIWRHTMQSWSACFQKISVLRSRATSASKCWESRLNDWESGCWSRDTEIPIRKTDIEIQTLISILQSQHHQVRQVAYQILETLWSSGRHFQFPCFVEIFCQLRQNQSVQMWLIPRLVSLNFKDFPFFL